MVGRTAAQGRIPALKRTVFTSHGENPRRIGRIRREPALSGAFRAERTPHFARSFLPSPECRQNVETGWRREGDLNFQYPSFDRFKLAEKNRDRTLSSPVPVLEILSYFLLFAFRTRAADP
jgi:hypothetical protein